MSDESTNLELDELKALIEMLREHAIEEFEYSKGDVRIRIVHHRSRDQGVQAADSNNALLALATSILQGNQEKVKSTVREVHGDSEGNAAPAKGEMTGQTEAEVEEAETEELHIITSPIVGTFYRAPSPDAEPFVEVGDKVHEGQTVCIVEAMKIMNEIQADIEGEIASVYAANGAPVEYGQRLLAIRSLEK